MQNVPASLPSLGTSHVLAPERLDAYRVALELDRLVVEICQQRRATRDSQALGAIRTVAAHGLRQVEHRRAGGALGLVAQPGEAAARAFW